MTCPHGIHPLACPTCWPATDPHRPVVLASHADTLTLSTAPEVTAASADAEGRTVEGIVVPWGPGGGEVGYTNVGPITVEAGAIHLPDDLGVVKLVDEHSTPPRPIGYAIAAEARREGLWMRFRIGSTVRADNALTEALERLRDAFSVELSDVTYDDRGTVPRVMSSALPAVALVTVPAFGTARVSQVAASMAAATTTDTGDNMTDEQRARLTELRALPTLTQGEATELAALTMAEAAEEVDPAAVEAPEAALEASAGTQVAASRPATVPAGIPGTRQAAPRRDVRELFAAQARVLTGRSRPDVEAALSNITMTANIWTQPDGYAGQLWEGVGYNRVFVNDLNHADLTSYKVRGWRWVVKPEVDDYAGDKTAVPSNSPTTEEVEVAAARLAGAHDIDRAKVDFGDTEFFAAYYAAMSESYAYKSDNKAKLANIAGANANVSATVATSLLKAAATAKVELSTYEDDSFAAGEPDWYYVNAADWLALLDTTNDSAPAYLADLGITPDKLRPVSGVPAGAVMAGVKAAGTFYELSETPIRVETVNVANGGVDGGVFGYWASLTHHAKGRVRVNFA
jgi:hypothetical protein